jgi:hypothetical protein
MNERYQKHTAPSGTTRRSAASAKPKRTTDGSAPSTKGKGGASARQRVPLHPPTEEYRKLRRIWWVFLGGAIVLSTVAWVLWRQPIDKTIGTAVLIAGYVCIGAAIWLDFTKMRPLRQAWMKEQQHDKKS